MSIAFAPHVSIGNFHLYKSLLAYKITLVNELTDRYDTGIQTVIVERGVKLSGGQRQRVAIAHVILADPGRLILDEATSNLDTESESYIQESLKGVDEGRETFAIANRLSTIGLADQILVVEHGYILEKRHTMINTTKRPMVRAIYLPGKDLI
jgi:subfamily B ATP-binding cassette protein MsbA